MAADSEWGYLARGAAEARESRGDAPEFIGAVTQTERNPATRLTEHIYTVDLIPNGRYTAITITPKSRSPTAQRLQRGG